LPAWRIVHTPGHTSGHVSLFREEDRCLIAGDAVITMNQENAAKLMSHVREFRRPPVYFTQDWESARDSVRKLADLQPSVVASGHGLPIFGENTAQQLREFADAFTPPRYGRYVADPVVTDAEGIVSIPPAPRDPVPAYAAGIAMAAAGLMLLGASRKRANAEDRSRQMLDRW
jgi:glyoxylase-like metal-dependent hydrolase (beta-lactamase superfamily II)